MKIVIKGAGAMGSLFRGLLTFLGEEIWLVDARKKKIDAIRSVGLTVDEKEKRQFIAVNATTDVRSLGKANLILFFVKTHYLEKAVSDSLVLQKEDKILLTLQ
jgi:2-dehydropantoate 2-reductase